MKSNNTVPIYQCVPNFSEGRNNEIVRSIASAISNSPGIDLLDYSADADHNRSVMTFLGSADAIALASMNAAEIAIDRIDLNYHAGVHPRMGAIDVLPVVPIRGGTLQSAVDLARRIGYALAEQYNLPVYFYEWAAFPSRQSALPDLRQGGFEKLVGRELTGANAPDAGPSHAHPTAGAMAVGARGPLIAYNINFKYKNDQPARKIAAQIRNVRNIVPELDGVRALGLYLEQQKMAQVSMNITRPHEGCLPIIFEYIRRLAADLGITDVQSEIIGVIPPSALGGASPEMIAWNDFKPSQILPFEPEAV